MPDLCETIDYAEVQGVLFPRVAVSPPLISSKAIKATDHYPKLVFTKTRILSVKVATLETFLSMVKTLDQVGDIERSQISRRADVFSFS